MGDGAKITKHVSQTRFGFIILNNLFVSNSTSNFYMGGCAYGYDDSTNITKHINIWYINLNTTKTITTEKVQYNIEKLHVYDRPYLSNAMGAPDANNYYFSAFGLMTNKFKCQLEIFNPISRSKTFIKHHQQDFNSIAFQKKLNDALNKEARQRYINEYQHLHFGIYGKNNLGIGADEVIHGPLHMFLRGSITLLEYIGIITHQMDKLKEFTYVTM